jgi:hypothetical protein
VLGKVSQSTSTAISQKEGYFIILGSMGSVARLDYFFYQYTFTNAGLQKSTDKVILYAYAVAAVDVKKVDNVNAFKVLIDSQYQKLDLK